MLLIDPDNSSFLGSLCSILQNSTVFNSSASGVIIANGGCVGGFIGLASESKIENCFSAVSIVSTMTYPEWSYNKKDFTAPDYGFTSGGLVGNLLNSSIVNSHFKGIMKTPENSIPFFGDLVGFMGSSNIRDSHSFDGERKFIYNTSGAIKPRLISLKPPLAVGIKKIALKK